MQGLLLLVPRSLLQATANPHSWTLLGKSESISCGVTAHFSWVLVGTRFSLCPPRVHFPVLCKFRQLCGRVNGDILQEGLCHPHTQSPCPCGRPLPTHIPQEMLKHNSVPVSVGSLGPGAHKVYLSPLSISGGNGV